MAVVAGLFLYDVADPVHPRMVCRATKTYMQLVDSNTIAYTVALSGGKANIVWRDLVTGVNTQVAVLPADPGGAKNWTADGSLEVYAGKGTVINETTASVPVHLFSNGGDHLLYSITSGASGLESRWSQVPILEFSTNHTYFAISDARYAITSSSMHIFSVADRRQLLVTVEGPGGTWVADDRFVWSAATTGSLVQWTPQGGVATLRPEKSWFGVNSSPGGQWLAGTLLSSAFEPHVLIAPVAGGTAVKTGLGSAPGFVSRTVLWYIGEKACTDVGPCGYDPTAPDGTVHAYDVTTKIDQVLHFRAGEEPVVGADFWYCCSTRV
jgi:hypothetical protein